MRRGIKLFFLFLGFFLINIMPIKADVGFLDKNIWLSKENPLDGDRVKIYSVVVNDHDYDIQGEVVFFDNKKKISDPIKFYLIGGGSSQLVSATWIATRDNHQFTAIIQNAYIVNSPDSEVIMNEDGLSRSTEMIFVDIDSDQDGIGNKKEIDSGTDPNNPDSDGDGEDDRIDPKPTDSSVFLGPDTDNDKISDKVDTDLDNDGLYNWEEEEQNLDPMKYDTDGDGHGDKDDEFPTDPQKWEKEESLDFKIKASPHLAEAERILKNNETSSEYSERDASAEVPWEDMEESRGEEKFIFWHSAFFGVMLVILILFFGSWGFVYFWNKGRP